MKKPYHHDDVIIMNSKLLHNGFCRLEECLLKTRLSSGKWSATYSREILIKNNVVAALLYDPKRQSLILIEQFRVGAYRCGSSNPWLLEIAAGQVAQGMSNEEALAKEILEETGLTVTNAKLIYNYYVSPGLNSEEMFLYYAEVDSKKAKKFSGIAAEHEDIKIKTLHISEALNYLSSGKIRSAVTIIAIQWLEKAIIEKKI